MYPLALYALNGKASNMLFAATLSSGAKVLF